MKTLILGISLLLTVNSFAKDYEIKGDEARTMMETLAAAGFEVSNLDEEWVDKTLEIRTGPFSCHYSVAYYPDQWMSSVDCFEGTSGVDGPLNNSLALAQAVRSYAFGDAGLGNRWLSVDNVSCSLVYNTRDYACKVSAEAN